MSIGETLAAAREQAGLSVEDVSRETRIRSGLIRAIERDDFGLCGGDVYARGHIRNIATLVGIDPRPLVADYDKTHGGGPIPVDNPAPAFDPEVATRSERKRPNWAAAMAVALVAICVIAGVQLASKGGSSKPPKASRAATQHPAPSPSTQPSPGPVPSGAVAQVPRQGVHVQVRIVGATDSRSWLHVAGSDGSTLFEGILAYGDRAHNFADPSKISLTIGNAGAVDLVVNGRDRGLAGSSGEVVHRSFHPQRYAGTAA